MKRSPLKRSKPLARGAALKRGTPLKRGARLRPVNSARRRARSAETYGDRGALVRSMPCLLAGPGCRGLIEAAHVRSRGAGGTRRDLVPLCSGHHLEQHTRGIRTFAADHRLDLVAEAGRIAVDLDTRGVL